ncbi:nuclear factor NF-kappa-B p100 subunit-like [Littorina saxatilis]|uniref:nuclear factor NF-kappa-B p100 subunit-like n=1 Tax=Littorina saxatilis TaxID=31220 RepID=UPI0038B4F973
MEFSGENSRDSVEIDDSELLAMQNVMSIPTDITFTDPSPIMNGGFIMDNNDNNQQPRVVIVEQPQQRGFRFRYECEGPSHGGLQGEKTERGRKTYPSIRIENYSGPAHIEVSLVTDEDKPKVHAHKLVGKNCNGGVCKIEMNSTASDISFPNLCILHVTRKKAAEVLANRLLEQIKLNKRMVGGLTNEPTTTAEENLEAKKEAQELSRNMSLNVVRLQFQVFLTGSNGQFLKMLNTVISQPIYDSKSPGASALKICRMDKYGGCCTGNEEVFLLCEKVQKEDIAVRFVEHNEDGSIKWESYGNFSPLDVHRQYAIVFKTPAYYNPNIDKAVNVMIMLQRKSDVEVSEAKAFTYYPQNKDKDNIARKKRKTLPLDNTFNYYGGDGGPGGGPPGPGGGMGGGGFGSVAPGGPGGGMGGGGGGGGHGNFSVIMPNGSVTDQLHVLPTTVEQVVKEEFARSHAESPDTSTTSTEDSNPSPITNPFDPMLWAGSFPSCFNDLEMDAAHSLSHPSQSLVSKVQATPTKRPPVIPENSSKSGSESARSSLSKTSKTKPVKKNSTSQKMGNTFHQESRDSAELNKADTSSSEPKHKTPEKLTGEKSADEVIVDSCEAAGGDTPKRPLKNLEIQAHSETDSGREDHSDTVHSPTPTVLSEATTSEGFRTDEGFSEVSSASGKEDALPKKIEMQQNVAPPKASSKKEGGKEKSSKPVKVATSVVKRVMERITTRTIRALQDYAETGDVRYLLIVQRHLTVIKNENGDLPIHLAVINNQTTSLQHMLDVMTSLPHARHSINMYNYMRQTALHLAAIMQQPYHIELLLRAGADPSVSERNGNTPAHLAVMNNSLEALRSLIKYLRPGVTASNPFPELDYLNFDGYTSVHLAAQSGNVDMLRLLVHGRADVDMPDGKSGRTALHHAVELDDLPVAGFLLMEANADVNARCFDGNTALHIACCRGLIGMVALLMTAGALTDVENEEVPPGDMLQQEAGEGEEQEEEEAIRRYRRGLQPRDYAAGKDRLRILSMLIGDHYASDEDERLSACDNDLEEDKEVLINKSVDSGMAESLRSQTVASLQAEEKLSEDVRVELSKVLDPLHAGKDVYELASRLGYDQLVAPLEVMGESGSSPTTFLLDYHETYGTVSKLKECLHAMERDDAVRLIEEGDRGLLHRKQMLDSSLGDSGVVSFNS